MNPKTQEIMSEVKDRFGKIYGRRLAQIALFGSQARNDARPESDIDVLVVLNGVVNPVKEIANTGEATSFLSLKHDVVISCVFISSDRFATEQSPFLLNIRKEGIPV